MSNRVDAWDEWYDLVEVKEQPMLFTCLRVDRTTVPKGYFLYEVREDDDGNGEPCQIAKGILVNHLGTLISNKPISLPADGYLDIDPEDDWNYTGDSMRLSEYMKEYPAKKDRSQER